MFIRKKYIVYLKFIFLYLIIILLNSSILNAEIKVFPKIISPGSPPYNEEVYFEYHSISDNIPELYIYDIYGTKIRKISSLNPQSIGKNHWRLKWDGKDDNGSFVIPGIYIYLLKEDNRINSGTIIVAR